MSLQQQLQRARKIFRPRESIRLIAHGRWDYLCYLLRFRLKGVDLESASLEELRLSSDRSVEYRDSGGPDLARVLKSIKIAPGACALDLGCGKAGALITLAEFPFAQVMGLEISSELVEVARRNIAILKLSNIDFVCGDAGAFKDLDKFTHVYLYNPFPAPVVNQVLEKLAASLQRRPRSLWIIYRNPVCHAEIMATGLFRKSAEFKFRKESHPFYVYSHD